VSSLINGTFITVTTTTTTTTTKIAATQSVPQLVPLEVVANLHKQTFPYVTFKCLNLLIELAQHSIKITAKTDKC